MLIVIDPGHGGHDPGAIGPTGLHEADVALDVGRIVRELLIEHGHQVRMTRDVDVFVDLPGRAAFANRLRADLFLSIHCNATTYPAAHGVETWYFSGSRDGERLARAIQSALVTGLGGRDRGVKQSSTLSVLRRTAMPAVLVEIGFVSNPVEEAWLGSHDGKEAVARAIVSGVLAYIRERGET